MATPLWILKHDDIRKPLLAKCQPTLFKIDKPMSRRNWRPATSMRS